MTKPNKGVKYIEGILKEVSKELGRSEDEVREVWDIHKKYLKTLMDKDDVYIIELPKLGNLIYNTFTQTNLEARSRSTDEYTKLKGKTKRLREIVKEHEKKNNKTKYLYPQLRRSNFYNLYMSIQRNIFKKHKKYAPINKAIDCVEEYSINMYKKENE